MKWISIKLINFYQNRITQLNPGACRFTPTCSEYTKQCIERYGFFQGGLMGYRRIMNCHPNGKSGHDPVP
mgnify:CR=1 FL=1